VAIDRWTFASNARSAVAGAEHRRPITTHPVRWLSCAPIVPTIDSERFLDHVIDFYADIEIPVLFAVTAAQNISSTARLFNAVV
jgi:hypothetical protein